MIHTLNKLGREVSHLLKQKNCIQDTKIKRKRNAKFFFAIFYSKDRIRAITNTVFLRAFVIAEIRGVGYQQIFIQYMHTQMNITGCYNRGLWTLEKT